CGRVERWELGGCHFAQKSDIAGGLELVLERHAQLAVSRDVQIVFWQSDKGVDQLPDPLRWRNASDEKKPRACGSHGRVHTDAIEPGEQRQNLDWPRDPCIAMPARGELARREEQVDVLELARDEGAQAPELRRHA